MKFQLTEASEMLSYKIISQIIKEKEKMIEIGKEFSTELLINRKIIKDCFFCDLNPIHLDEKKAKNFGFNKPVAHGEF